MIQYKLVSKVNPRNMSDPKKYYAQAIPTKKVKTRQLIEEISFSTAINGAAVAAVLEALLELLPKHLIDGKHIQLGELGSFRLVINSKGVEKPELFTTEYLKGVKILFRPSSEISKRLSQTTFQKVGK